MPTSFYEQPILNSPYEPPRRHWELDANRQPTDRQIERRREAAFITSYRWPRCLRLRLGEMKVFRV